ncbi:WYL domain-containing protein (plasmid) [Diaphorobacter sp. HDW4B]|uniref:helix-turn-helix transcriptional regulator n=1 Tax=Diaphorobacter sp. HDW4B TaxID=2714925 RepID=UPI00140DA64B|nr:WYL domain-containing protein [Diaphorobacter sp. HDW4B]QIL74141.1 WYL domain-containing protein [Diaphorobacter sp. HDW4B]
MPKRPDTLETVKLAMELLKRIPRHGKITAQQLHEQLMDAGIQRELRSVQRQLEMLSEHFDIERDDRSRPYGYSWQKDSKAFALPYLTTQEALLLRLAEEHLRQLLPTRLMRSMDAFFAQARRNLHGNENAKLEREWPKKIRVVATSQPLLPPTISQDVFASVTEALYSNKWLTLDYRNANKKRSTAEVMPLGLAQQGPRFYLVCRYRDYQNERSLAMHRILGAKVSTLSFDRPSEFDLKKYDDDGRFGFGNGKRVRLSFQIENAAGYHLLESMLSQDQQSEELPNGDLKITATVVDSAMLEWWLRGFGDAVKEVTRTPVDEVAV